VVIAGLQAFVVSGGDAIDGIKVRVFARVVLVGKKVFESAAGALPIKNAFEGFLGKVSWLSLTEMLTAAAEDSFFNFGGFCNDHAKSL
jgi:hypothetical protein